MGRCLVAPFEVDIKMGTYVIIKTGIRLVVRNQRHLPLGRLGPLQENDGQ